MKTKELMIGDWVMYNPNVFIEDEYEPTKECYPTRISNGADIDLAIENCYIPIPLTAEILKKNGFLEIGKIRNCYIHCFYEHIRYYEIEINLHDNMLWINKLWFKANNIHYVHELQHALRLCKIEKEIKL